MGIYELQPLNTPGMHWERHQMLAAAYDPSRDLSPNLPCQESSSNSSGCSSTSSRASGSSGSSGGGGGGVCCKQEPGGYGSCHECSPPPPPQQQQPAHQQQQQPAHQQQQQQPLGHHHHHHHQRELVVCAGCNARITDRFYLFAVDRRWHASCLQCSQCRLPLDGEVTCFARDGSIYCKKDYYRLFGMKRCGRCQATILSSELVMRARELVFHVHCFTCAVCSTLLTKGDTFGMREGAVFCRLHYTELPPPSPPPHLHHHHHHPPFHQLGGGQGGGQGGPPLEPPPPHEFHPRVVGPPPPQPPPGPPPPPPDPAKMPNPFFNGAPPPRQKGRPRKRKPKDLEAMTANLDLNSESAYLDVAFGPGTPGMGGANGAHHQRTKRMRTSFKHHQLRTMKSYFAINHNPDAKDLKQLSQKTGLPKRVLQVWFQNARAKWRRMVLKQEGAGGGGGGGKGDKCVEAAGGGYHVHGGGPPLHHSPQHYLSPSPLECSS